MSVVDTLLMRMLVKDRYLFLRAAGALRDTGRAGTEELVTELFDRADYINRLLHGELE